MSIARRAVALGAIPFLSILLALILASVLIIISGVIGPKQTFDPTLPLVAYGSLIQGSLGSLRGISNTLVATAPLVLTGLAVGVGFKAGLFNIGADGQFLMGAVMAAGIGAMLATAPAIVAIPVALLAAAVAGALWGFIPGALKAWTGAHEVVTTIMLNFIGRSLVSYLVLYLFQAPGYSFSRTGPLGNAELPTLGFLSPDLDRLNLAILIALLLVPAMWWLLFRSTLGFEIRTVGKNPDAARYAGMRPALLTILTMSLSGLLAGVAGGLDILGAAHYIPASYGTTVGFDSIAVALLGRSHPVGILLAGLLFGALRAGAGPMQLDAHIPVELVDVIQAVILLFLAADVIVRQVLRIRRAKPPLQAVEASTESYGKQAAL